jgi:peroxiredoxin Q/BCP
MTRLGRALAIGCCTLAVGMLAGAEEAKKTKLDKGDKAPVFTATDDQGQEWKSSDHVGKKILVVYFFPAALTGG